MPCEHFPKLPESKALRLSDYLPRLLTRIFARSERFVSGRYWSLEILFLAVLFTILFSGGVDDRLWQISNNYYYQGYFEKIEHPLADVTKTHAPETHDAKLNFRLTVPVILHLLRVSPNERWILPALTACAICGLIWLSCLFAFRVTHDRVCALYAALAVASTYIGSFAFTMYYDAIALAQLTLAMLPGLHWSWKGLFVFTACFTDERAFLASPLLLVQTLCLPGSVPLRNRIFHREFLAVLGGMALYCLGRLLLMKYAHLSTPLASVDFANFMWNVRFWHAGLWLALKGSWLWIGLAIIALRQNRQFLPLALFIICLIVIASAGFFVEDVIRSTSYIFPASLIALLVISRHDNTRSLRIYCLIAFLISAITGNYNIWRGELTWFQPLAVKLVYHFFDSILHIFKSGIFNHA